MIGFKRSFTLLELIVVIIIIGVLATLGFIQYSRVVEKGRRAEAATNLGALRSMAYVWHQEGGHPSQYPATADLQALLGLPSSCSQTTHYFAYSMNSGNGTGTATRCTSGGKPPVSSEGAYSLSLTIDGAKSSSPANLW
jgi:prepilin-type N-terminal cleavage/methylation domain-containing protein